MEKYGNDFEEVTEYPCLVRCLNEQTIVEDGSVVTDCQLDSNNKSDSEFFQKQVERDGHQEEKTIISEDRAYSGDENTELVTRNNKLITTDLKGKDVDLVIGAFKMNEGDTKVFHCPAGNVPKLNRYNKWVSSMFHLKETNVRTARLQCTASRRSSKGSVSILSPARW